MDVPVYNMQGQEAGSVSIDEAALGGVVNPALIKQAYVRYHANLRQGSARNKGRGDLTKTGKKWYKQKGTGRARHGDRKVPIMVGGGVTFAKRKHREDYHLDMPKKMRRKANRNALLAKLVDNEVKIIDDLSMDAPKTKAFVDLMAALGLDRGTLLALSGDPEKSKNARLSARNVEDITMCRADQLTAFEMLNHRYLVIGKSELEAWLSGPSSQTDKSAKTDPQGRVEKVSRVRRKDPRKERAQARKAAAAGKGGE
ncbi:MAG: 50S ribosomal protein L4 [Planctomycetota bacterium]